MKKVLHADMQLSTPRSKDYWSAHILSAMEGLTQSYIFKQRLQHCEPIDLSRFVVDLRERHLEYWTPYLKLIRENTTANTITNGVLFLPNGLWSLIRLTFFPNACFMFLVLPHDVIRSAARSDLVFTPYVLRQ